MMRRSPSGAYSDKKIAVANPTGTATSAPTSVTSIVPDTSGSTPYDLGLRMGDQFVPVRNSQTEISTKNPHAFMVRLSRIPNVVRTETSAHAKNSQRTTVPSQRLRERLNRGASVGPGFAVGLREACVNVVLRALLDRVAAR